MKFNAALGLRLDNVKALQEDVLAVAQSVAREAKKLRNGYASASMTDHVGVRIPKNGSGE